MISYKRWTSTKIIRLELSEKLWHGDKHYTPWVKREKMGLPCFELRWLLNDMKVPWYPIFSFLVFCLKTAVRESKWMRTTSVTVMVNFFFESVIPKVLDHSYYNPPWQQHLKDTLQLRILWTWSTWTLRTWSLYQDIWLCVCSSFSQTSLVFKFNLLLIK